MKLRPLLFSVLFTLLTVPAFAAPDLSTSHWSTANLIERWDKLVRGGKRFFGVQSEACRPYTVGEIRGQSSELGNYKIKKVAENNYIAYLNIKFLPAAGTSDQQVAQMRRRVKTCFKNAGFLTSKNGERLAMVLYDLGEPSARFVFKSDVHVHTEIDRANSGNYALDSSCETILHEGLHLLGLWDEYKEITQDMRCRAIGSSIMSDHSCVRIPGFVKRKVKTLRNAEAFFPENRELYFKNRLLSRFMQAKSVTCYSSSNSQLFIFLENSLTNTVDMMGFASNGPTKAQTYDSFKGLYVPEESSTFTTYSGLTGFNLSAEWVQHFARLDSTAWKCNAETNAIPVIKTGAELFNEQVAAQPHALRPAHLRKILYPDCEEKNKTYELCTSEAYLVPKAGYQCVKDRNPICQTERWLD